ncbi:MAG: universal stress protein [Desulfobulbaceae bacterium]|nr:universal stress protein [Desulfobulbaceae bacterium]
MIKKILVPIAFSKYAKGILTYAADLAESTGAELVVVNVINERDLEAVDKITSFGYKVDIEHYMDTIKKERRAELTVLMESLTLPDEKVTFTFCVGDPTYELLKIVVDQKVDAVVMGVKTNDIRHIFTGSVAERMFRKCPVTIVSYRDDEISESLLKKFTRHRGKEQ